MIYPAILVILITEAAKVREHLWAGVTHEHWAKTLWISGLAISDPFHLVSFLSHYVIVTFCLWRCKARWYHYLITAILSQLIWWEAKVANGRDWPNKGEQLWNYLLR